MSSDTETLKEKLKYAQGTERVDILNALNTRLILSNTEQVMEYAKEAYDLSVELNYEHGTLDTLTWLGAAHKHIADFPEALKYTSQVIEIAEKIGDKDKLLKGLIGMSYIYTDLGKPDEAEIHLNRAQIIAEELKRDEAIFQVVICLGATYYQQGHIHKALDLLESQLEYARNDKVHNAHDNGSYFLNLGALYYVIGNYEMAMEYTEICVSVCKQLNNKPYLTKALSNLGEIYARLDKPETALEWYQKALKAAIDTKDTSFLRNIYEEMSALYEAQNNLSEALKNYKLYKSTSDELQHIDTQKEITKLHIKSDIKQKEKVIEVEQQKNSELKKERDRSEVLLLNILPAEVAEELKEKGSANARLFDEVTVLFTDFKGFTSVSERLSPQQLVDELHSCFSAFDHIVSKYNIEKIKTVGDAYLAASGLPTANPNHAQEMVFAAIEIRDYMLTRRNVMGEMTFEIRIGIHSGPVVAGIVGVRKFAYDIWGDTVNTAARMEQNSQPGRINISQTTYEIVKDKFTCQYRGEIEAKNKGLLKMYFVE